MSSHRAHWFLKVAAIVLPLALGCVIIAQKHSHGLMGNEWEAGHVGYVGSYYTGSIAKNFAKFGFSEMGYGAPMRVVPAEPPIPEHYLNHPVPYNLLQGWLYKTYGAEPSVLKIEGAVFTLLMILATVLLVWSFGPWAAMIAGSVTAVVPFNGHFGFMLAGNHPCLMLSLVCLALFRRWQATGSGVSRALFFALLFLNSQLDWYGYFVYPVLILHLLVMVRPFPWKLVIGLFVFSMINLAIIVGQFSFIVGSLDGGLNLINSLAHAGGSSVSRFYGKTSGWHEMSFGFLRDGLTFPILIVAILGTLGALVRGPRLLVLELLLLGLLPCYVFYAHADHSFWPHTLTPWAATSAAWLLACLARVKPQQSGVLVACVTIGLLVLPFIETDDLNAQGEPASTQALIDTLNLVGKKDDILLFSEEAQRARYYLDFFVDGPIRTPEEMAGSVEFLNGIKPKGRILAVVYHQGVRYSELLTWLRERFPEQNIEGMASIFTISP